MSEQLPNINEVINLLARRAPKALDELRCEFPENYKMLEGGLPMGLSGAQVRASLKACIIGLDEAIKDCDEHLPKARQDLTKATQFQFVAQAVALLGGATAVLSVLFPDPKTTAAIGGIITLLSSLCSLGAQYKSSGLHADSGSLYDNYKVLAVSRPEAMRLRRELGWRAKDAQELDEELKGLIAQTNKVSDDINRAIANMK